MTDKFKVVPISSKQTIKEEENESLVLIEYNNGAIEEIEADAFAESQELEGFLAFWKEEPYVFLGYRNSKHILSIKVVTKEVGEKDE